MPIATLVEQTIVPRMAFSFSTRRNVGRGNDASRTLPFKHVSSTDYRTVWAAAAASVAWNYDAESASGLTQPQVEAKVRTVSSRSGSGARTDVMELALRAVGHYEAGPISAQAESATIISEILQGRPVCARIVWSSGLQHFVVIFGYRIKDGRLEYVVDDPLHGILSVSDWSLSHSYLCDGRWADYYLTR